MKGFHTFALAALALAALPLSAALKKAPEDGSGPSSPVHHIKSKTTLFSGVIVEANEEVDGSVKAVIGHVQVDGAVTGNASSFMGDTTINGTVGGSAVAIMGDLVLGPNARVEGDAICVGGRLIRDPNAIVLGQVRPETLSRRFHFSWPQFGRWMGGLPVTWPRAGLLLLCVLVTLMFPRAIEVCGAIPRTHPGTAIVAACLTLAAFPIVFVFLIVTLVGIPLAIFVLPAALFLLWLVGTASIYALVGRWLTRGELPLWLATLVGGLVCSALFLIPVAGPLLFLAVSWFMIGCVVAVLVGAAKRQPVGP